jgi:quercetin dioxygenase-like cupin family protein
MMTTSDQASGASSDRVESIQRVDDTAIKLLMPGVELCPLVGAHNGARNLFTGLMTLAPKASYPLYARPFVEALIVLEGDMSIEVEDRRYRLQPFDSIAVTAQVPRRLMSLSTSRPTVLHIALASATPAQTWVNGRFTAMEQPTSATGREGAERVCRSDPGARFELAPSALFQDLYNVDLGARGISGGYGIFEPGARLPCHRHEFDESITIVEGAATCVVEGRRHELSGKATALVPQGRCHYFINLTLQPMAMIWVYAGDRPDRIVMDEVFCHPK